MDKQQIAEELGLPIHVLDIPMFEGIANKYREYESVMNWMGDTLDSGDLINIDEAISENSGWYVGYIEDIIFAECWRVI